MSLFSGANQEEAASESFGVSIVWISHLWPSFRLYHPFQDDPPTRMHSRGYDKDEGITWKSPNQPSTQRFVTRNGLLALSHRIFIFSANVSTAATSSAKPAYYQVCFYGSWV